MCEGSNKIQSIEFTKRFATFLEIKWEMIKHDVIKFCTCYKAMVVSNEFWELPKRYSTKDIGILQTKAPKAHQPHLQ